MLTEYAFISVNENGEQLLTQYIQQPELSTEVTSAAGANDGIIHANVLADVQQENSSTQVLMLQPMVSSHQGIPVIQEQLADGTQVTVSITTMQSLPLFSENKNIAAMHYVY